MTFTCLSQHGRARCARGAGMWCSLGPRRLQGLGDPTTGSEETAHCGHTASPENTRQLGRGGAATGMRPAGVWGICPRCRHPSCPARVMTQ